MTPKTCFTLIAILVSTLTMPYLIEATTKTTSQDPEALAICAASICDTQTQISPLACGAPPAAAGGGGGTRGGAEAAAVAQAATAAELRYVTACQTDKSGKSIEQHSVCAPAVSFCNGEIGNHDVVEKQQVTTTLTCGCCTSDFGNHAFCLGVVGYLTQEAIKVP